MPLAPRSDTVRLAYEKGYRVDESGIARSKAGRIVGYLRKNSERDPYVKFRVVTARPNRKCRDVKRAHLQAFQKFGEKLFEPGILVRHLDGNPQNDSAANIAIGTPSDNMMDKPALLRSIQAGNANRKYSPLMVAAMLNDGMTYKQIVSEIGISKGALSNIVRNILGRTPNGKRHRIQQAA